MECKTCETEDFHGIEFLCPSCVHSILYTSRLEQAEILLDKERLGKEVDSVINIRDGGALTENTSKWQIETLHVEKAKRLQRLEEIKDKKQHLFNEIEALREQVKERQAHNHIRKDLLDAAQHQALPQHRSTLSSLSDSQARNESLLRSLDQKSMANKAELCREAALLMSLRQQRRQREGFVREQFFIAGLFLPDLKEINNARCIDLTAVLTNVVHVVKLICFYLGIRLPAEILAPEKDFSLPAINTPANSYKGKRADFKSVGPSSTAGTPSDSNQDLRGSYRPRPLFIGSSDPDERLFHIAKKDPATYNFFVDGISLLAWDIAWLCRSQGFTIGTNSWEDICNIGKNLYQLVVAPPQSPGVARMLSMRNVQRRMKPNRQASLPVQEAGKEQVGMLGLTSHDSTVSFLGNAVNNGHFRVWQLNKYHAIADALRKWLLTEMNNAEWELLQEQEWDDGGEQFGDAVHVKTRLMDGHTYDDARSIMTTRTQMEEAAFPGSKVPGTSGWTKLKSRDKT